VRLKVSRLSYEDLQAQVDTLLRQHNPTGKIPVPIEKIVEFGFGLTLVPIHDLQTVYEVDAFTAKDLQTIYVDHATMMSRSPYRYRFSLAHELAHVVLHRPIYKEVHFRSAAEWKKMMLAMDEADRSWIEWQANNFAGLLLVPRAPLRSAMQKAVTQAAEHGLDVRGCAEVAKDYVCEGLSRTFEASGQVIAIRVEKDGLWPPT